MTRIRLTCVIFIAVIGTGIPPSIAQSLDFEAYRTKVQPIFLKKRTGHARCAVCHEANNSAFRLEKRPPEGSSWSEDQSRKNFEFVKNLVNPRDPTKSRAELASGSWDADLDASLSSFVIPGNQ